MNNLFNLKRGRMLTNTSSEECKFLYEIFYAIQNVGSIMAAQVAVYNYTVGATNGPVAGGTTFTLPINPVIANNNPVYKNNVALTKGTDYTINLATGVFTLLLTTFTVNDIYTFI